MKQELRKIDMERERRKIMDRYFANKERDIQHHKNGSLSHLNFEFTDPRGFEFCVCYDYVDASISPRSTKAWKFNHVNKWFDPAHGKAGDIPWISDIKQAEKEISKNGIRIDDMFRYVLILERNKLSKKSASGSI